jgi:hypothetical protein
VQGRFLITNRNLAAQESLAVAVDQIIGKVNLIPQEGVVDLVNFFPNISIEEPDCTTKVVKVHATVASPHKIATLTLTTSDSPDWTGTANFQVNPVLPTQSPDATFNLPEGQQVYTFVITAKDDASNEYKLNGKIDRTGCVPASALHFSMPTRGHEIRWYG